MAVRLDYWVRSLCQEAIYANADFVLSQRNTFMALLKDEYHTFFLNDNSFMNIENMKYSLYLIPAKKPLWTRLMNLLGKNKNGKLKHFRIGSASQNGALLCEISISRDGKSFDQEIKIEGQKIQNENIYVDET